MPEAHPDILLHTELSACDGERIGSPSHIDESTCQALEGTQEAPRGS